MAAFRTTVAVGTALLCLATLQPDAPTTSSITQGHSDHALDAGHISRRAGAVVLGHETAANLTRAYGVPDSALITVLGGEDYAFDDGISIRVVPNIHSALEDKRYFNNGRGIAGTAPRGLKAPLGRVDYQEGGNLAYVVRIGGHEVLARGSMNYLEREMEGLRPDVALIGADSQRLEIFDYTGRLLRAMGYPPVVIPTQAEFEPIVLPARATLLAGGAAGGERRQINPPGISPLVPAYSVGMATGNEVFVSGMTSFLPGAQDIVEGGIAVQTRQTLENIRITLEAVGATMADVVECTVFLRDMADYAAMNREYLAFFPSDPPARATLVVSAFPRPAALVEIKCSARRRQCRC